MVELRSGRSDVIMMCFRGEACAHLCCCAGVNCDVTGGGSRSTQHTGCRSCAGWTEMRSARLRAPATPSIETHSESEGRGRLWVPTIITPVQRGELVFPNGCREAKARGDSEKSYVWLAKVFRMQVTVHDVCVFTLFPRYGLKVFVLSGLLHKFCLGQRLMH